MKRCCKCTTTKPLTDFHKDANQKDGHAKRCKTCANEVGRQNYAAHRERHLRNAKEYRDNNKEKFDEWRMEYRARHKDRVSAGLKLQWAIESGAMPRASELICESCGKNAQEYHHPDYSEPLKVVPLCKSCHRRVHGTK